GQPVEKSLDFHGSSRRLLVLLAPQRAVVTLSLLLGVASVVLSVLGPRLLGDVTNLIFSGVVGSRLPAGSSKAAVVAQLRGQGKGTLADMLARLHVVPGQGIDFGHVGQILLIVLLVYVGASICSLLQGRLTALVVQRAV